MEKGNGREIKVLVNLKVEETAVGLDDGVWGIRLCTWGYDKECRCGN